MFEELFVFIDFSIVIFVIFRDNGDDFDLLKDIMEFELDDVILVIDRSNKNNMDFYLLDEEFDEIKGMKIVMIILGVEDYVLISLFEEVSKEIKVILLMLILSI